MTGVASGLAASGYRPVTYTITPFNTLRCFEQIRLDICYPNLPVIIVGTGSGLSYASLGATSFNGRYFYFKNFTKSSNYLSW